MGVDVPGISVIIFLRPLNMVHYMVQGGGRGGRRPDTWKMLALVMSYWIKSQIFILGRG